jgi:hypothetical protein
MALLQLCPALRIGTSIRAITVREECMYAFTNRAPAHFPLAGKAYRIFKEKAVATIALKDIHLLDNQ